jgi:phospholipid/cholesterol/gamma-HCH transport system permease protein
LPVRIPFDPGATPCMSGMLTYLGRGFLDNLKRFWAYYLFALASLREILVFWRRRQTGLVVVYRQILFTGIEALMLISFIAIALGGLVILQGNLLLSNFGQSKFIHLILVTVVIRELAPLFTALIVIARSGSAISTELGNMVVNQEIDILRSVGINPLSYLVVPRVIGVVVALLTLTVYFSIASVVGGWLFSTLFFPVSFKAFFSDFIAQLRLGDLLIGLVKAVVFGGFIATISCFQGLSVTSASTEVPQRTIRAVVNSLVSVVFADVVITALYYTVVS